VIGLSIFIKLGYSIFANKDVGTEKTLEHPQKVYFCANFLFALDRVGSYFLIDVAAVLFINNK
jgi:hypothetical protein